MNKEEGIILIIEDDANLSELMADKVMESGFQHKSLMSGQEALVWLKTNAPLFMFLDFSLPDYTGTEFIHELEAQDIKVPPFVVATGCGDEMIAVEMMKLGARDYIIKNTSFLDMIGVITKQLYKDIENEKRLIQIENELKESNEFSRQIIEGVKEGIVVYDKQLNILIWNPYMEALTGYKAIDLTGRNITELFPNLDKSKIIENLKLALADRVNESIGLEFYFEFPETKKACWVSEMVSPLKNSDAKIIGAISTVRNITERKKAENDIRTSLSLLNATIESTTDGIMVIDKNDEISVCNSKFLELWNMHKDMLNKKSNNEIMEYVSLQTINPENFISSTIEINQAPDTTSMDIIEFIDGRIFERYSVPQYIDNKIAGRVWSMRDITKRIEAEKAILARIEEMTRFQKLTVGREMVMIELKKEINELCRRIGEKEKYLIVGEQ